MSGNSRVELGRTLALLLGMLAALPASAAPPTAAPAGSTADVADRIGACFGREDPGCAEPLLAALEAQSPGGTTVEFARGMVAFLQGRLDDARKRLERVATSPLAPPALRDRARSYQELAAATAEVHAGSQPHKLAGGRVVAWLRPGADEVLLPYLERVVGRALPALEAAFGPAGTAPIAVHVYPRVEDLGRVSGLTVEQIRTSGTIALCKHNRVMLTSPADLVFGYAWADTVAHELVHWFVIKHGGPDVPVWLHEGLARAFEASWRGVLPTELTREELRTLAAARKKGKFIPLARMHPSMALLPSQEDTQLAFAEVHHAVAWLLERAAKAPAPPANPAGSLVQLFGQGHGEQGALERFAALSPAAFASTWKRELHRAVLRDAAPAEGHKPLPLVFRGAPGAPRPANADARRHAELGDRLAVLSRPLAAAIEYRKAIAAGADDGPLLVTRLVRVLLDLGKIDDARQYLQPALDAWPEHAPLHVQAARADVAQGRYQQALETTDTAAWLNPYDPQVHALAAQAHAALGQEADAAAARAREQLVAERP